MSRHSHPLIFLACTVLLIAPATAAAQTNFGSVNLGSNATATVNVNVPTATAFTSIKVVTMGATGLDFKPSGTGTCTVGVTYAAGQTCTVGITFEPLYAGLRMGAVTLSNAGTGVYATTYLQGIGVGPEFAFNPGVASATDPVLNGRSLEFPSSLAVDGTETLFILDDQVVTGAIIKAPPGNAAPSSIIGHGVGGYNVDFPSAVAIDGAGNRIIVGGPGALAVRIPPGAGVGQTYTDPLHPTDGDFNGVAVDGAGDLFLLDTTYGDVVEFPTAPINAPPVFYTPQPDGVALFSPWGLAVDYAGNLFIADVGNTRVVEIPAGGGAAVAIQPIVNGLGVHPANVAVDGVGNLYIADSSFPSPTPRVVEVPVGGGPAFAIQPVVDGIAVVPRALAFDPAGNLFIADVEDISFNSRIVEVQRSPAALNFALTRVGTTSSGSPQTVLVQNVGTTALGAAPVYPVDFREDPAATDPCTASTSLSTGQTCNLSIDFHPVSAGNLAESVDISDPSFPYASAKVDVSGTATNVLLSAYSLSYGSQLIQTTSASQQVTLTNGSSSSLAIYGILVTGANASSFGFGSTCPATLPGGQSCIIHGHFAPAAAGPLTATVTITDNEADSPQSIALTGTGLTPPAVTLSGASLSFGTQQTGTTGASQHVTLTNTGGANLTIAGITVTGPNASSFVFGSYCPSSLPPAGSCIIHGHFTPTVTGALSATVTIVASAAGSPQSVALTGTGTSTAVTTVSVSPGVLNFGNQVVGRGSNSQFATLTNTGSGTLTVESVQLVGPNHSSFEFELGCAPTLAPGASCVVVGHFTPATLGPAMASIVFNVDIAGPPPTVSLTGTGVPNAVATLSATQINLGSIAVGQISASQSITVTNTGGSPLTFSGFFLGGASPSSFAFANDCGTLAVNASCTIHGHFAPTTTGPVTATLSIVDNGSPRAEDAVQTITLTGTGQ